jgi:hypothetical protein
MHGWKHWLIGAAFFGFAMFTLFTGGSPWLVGLCVVASAYIFYRALTDQTGAAFEDLNLAIDFVRDPCDTVFDEAVARLEGDEDEQPAKRDQPGVLQSFVSELGLGAKAAEEKPAFDPDAAIARYLANRPADAAPLEPAPPRAAAGFGRKGL